MKSLKILVGLLISCSLTAFSLQDQEPVSVRLSVSSQTHEGITSIVARARIRVDRKFESVPNLGLKLQISDQDSMLDAMTDHSGIARWVLTTPLKELLDTAGLVHFRVVLKDQQGFEDGEEELELRAIQFEMTADEVDSVRTVEVLIRDVFSGEVLEDVGLRFYVKRFFEPYWLSDVEFSNESGELRLALDEKLAGDQNGQIMIGALIEDDDLYGTVSNETSVPWGIPYIEDRAFEERSMWGTRDKTPYWLLIFPNLIIFGVWGTLIYLVYKLYGIYKL